MVLPVPSSPILVAEDVTKSYGAVRALCGITLTVGAGECVSLVGESGSGKSTLLKCFNGLVEPDSGRVLINGQPIEELDAVRVRRGTGYVPQEGGLLPHWTVARNARTVPWLLGRDDAEAAGTAALDLVGLSAREFGARYPAELSGGQRQRAAMARALAAQPEVLLLDEPFGALDAITRAEQQAAFAELRQRISIAIVLVTHDLAEAFRLSDRVAVFRSGRIEQCSSPSLLRGAPATAYVADLLAKADGR